MGVVAAVVVVLVFNLPNGDLKSWSFQVRPTAKYTAGALCKKIADAFIATPEHFAGQGPDREWINRSSACLTVPIAGTNS
jgi:hypothetical protein